MWILMLPDGRQRSEAICFIDNIATNGDYNIDYNDTGLDMCTACVWRV